MYFETTPQTSLKEPKRHDRCERKKLCNKGKVFSKKKKKKPRMILLNIKLIMYECVCMFNQ